MERTKIKIKSRRRAAKPVDVPQILELMEKANASFYMVETNLGITKGTVSRGVKEGTDRPIPPRWELPILKFLRKKISEQQDFELQTAEVKLELGLPVEEKQSDLPEEKKQVKGTWVSDLLED